MYVSLGCVSTQKVDMLTLTNDPSDPLTKVLSWSNMGLTIAVLIVTSKSFHSPSYCKMMVNVSSISLSIPLMLRKNAVTDAGLPKSTTAWSIEWDPAANIIPSPGTNSTVLFLTIKGGISIS